MNPLISHRVSQEIWVKQGADGIYEARRCLDGSDTDPFADGKVAVNYFHGRATTQETAIKILKREAAAYDSMMKGL